MAQERAMDDKMEDKENLARRGEGARCIKISWSLSVNFEKMRMARMDKPRRQESGN